MTTLAAEKLYLARHEVEMENKNNAIYNPHKKAFKDLPVIYGFNNGGSSGWLSAQLIAEDGTGLGGHCCSNEGYMQHDLGILHATRPDRHEGFKKHYPLGYRMEFVSYAKVKNHIGLRDAFKKNKDTEPQIEK